MRSVPEGTEAAEVSALASAAADLRVMRLDDGVLLVLVILIMTQTPNQIIDGPLRVLYLSGGGCNGVTFGSPLVSLDLVTKAR